ncbi:MAG: hypothetical protein ACLQPD_31885 [Desulfomonilaceae bacterium]
MLKISVRKRLLYLAEFHYDLLVVLRLKFDPDLLVRDSPSMKGQYGVLSPCKTVFFMQK